MLRCQEGRDAKHNRVRVGQEMHIGAGLAMKDTHDRLVNDVVSNFATCLDCQSPRRGVTSFASRDANRIHPSSGN